MSDKTILFVSIIIPVYNAEKTVGDCLKSVFTSEYKNFEVVLVDDNSTDDSLSIATPYHCKVVRMKENVGPAGARNRGAEASRGEILFFLDSDIIIERNTIEQTVRSFQGRLNISALFCSYQKNTVSSNFYSEYKNFVHHYTHQNSLEDAATFCGGFGAIKREPFFKFGGFDENYRSLEDMEFGYRLHEAGCEIYLNKQIQVTHCKNYTFVTLIKSDVLNRAIPWTNLMLHRKIFRSDLNVKINNVLSVPVAFLVLFNLPLIYFLPKSAFVFLLLCGLFLLLNERFFRFVLKERGTKFTIKTILMNWFSYLYSGVGLVIGFFSFLKESYFK
jgi:glycosyltransferase involved in cell wall biosynthesis